MNTDNSASQTVLVVDDNHFNQGGLELYLKSQGYQTLAAGDHRSAVELAARHLPPLAVVDIVLPATPFGPAESHLSLGLEVVRLLKHMNPSMGVVIFSAFEDRGPEVWSMVRDGMRGIAYLLKGSRPERVLAALEETAAGNVLLEPELARAANQMAEEMRARLSPEERPWVEYAANAIDSLTPREAQVVWRVAASHTTQSIATSLGIKRKTVETHSARAYRKLGFGELESKAPTLRRSVLLAKACMLYQLTHRR